MYWCCPLNEDFRLETFVIYVFFNQVITFLRWLTTVTAKEVTSRKKPYGKRKRLTVVSLGRQVFSFAVSLFLSAVRFLLLSRVFLFCREVISFAVTVVGHRTFCCRSHTKLKFREAFCFFFLQDRTLLSFPHNIPTLSHRNVGRICIVIYAGFVLTYFLLVPLFYEKDSICLTLGACRKITAAETHPITTEEIIISLSNTCDAALHSSCHSIIWCKVGSMISCVLSFSWASFSLSLMEWLPLPAIPLHFFPQLLMFCLESISSSTTLSFLKFTDITETLEFCSNTSPTQVRARPLSEWLKVSNVGLWIVSSACPPSVDRRLSLTESRLLLTFTLTRGARVLRRIVFNQPGIFVLL